MTDQTRTDAATPLNFRPPSTISPSPSTFQPPSITFLQGSWHVTHSTLPMWRDNKNVIITYTPITNPNHPGYTTNADNANPAIDDLVTYTPLKHPTKLKRVHGTDKPQSAEPGIYTWRGHGLLKVASSKWEVLGWGEERGGWCVTYFAKTLFTPPGVDVYSRGKEGLGEELLGRIKGEMGTVQDGEFRGLAGKIFEILHDED